jgi:hypothetical protein
MTADAPATATPDGLPPPSHRELAYAAVYDVIASNPARAKTPNGVAIENARVWRAVTAALDVADETTHARFDNLLATIEAQGREITGLYQELAETGYALRHRPSKAARIFTTVYRAAVIVVAAAATAAAIGLAIGAFE